MAGTRGEELISGIGAPESLFLLTSSAPSSLGLAFPITSAGQNSFQNQPFLDKFQIKINFR